MARYCNEIIFSLVHVFGAVALTRVFVYGRPRRSFATEELLESYESVNTYGRFENFWWHRQRNGICCRKMCSTTS